MILIKDEFVGGEKYRRAIRLGGDAAILMWLALKAYASKHPETVGFVPDEEIDDLLGGPKRPRKALDALVACGSLMPDGSRGAGLVDPAPGGWQLHDYLDHSVAPEELALRREKARVKKQRQRAEQRQELEELREVSAAIGEMGQRGTAGGQRGDSGGHVPTELDRDELWDTAGTSPRAGARPPAAAPARVPTPPLSAPPQPTLKSPSPASRIREPQHSSRPAEGAGEGTGHIQPQLDHQRFADEHGLKLEEFLVRLRRDPRSKKLSTVEGWEVLTRMLERAAAKNESVGGAA